MTRLRHDRPRVVLVDDHPQVLKALSRLLGKTCDVVASLGNAEQAIETAAMLKPDVMVVDLTMPEIDGLEVCRRVKNFAPEMDVIILTAFSDEHVEKAAYQAGASAFVAKHDAAVTLEGTIQRLMEKKQSGL